MVVLLTALSPPHYSSNMDPSVMIKHEPCSPPELGKENLDLNTGPSSSSLSLHGMPEVKAERMQTGAPSDPATRQLLKTTILGRRRARGDKEISILFEEPKTFKLSTAEQIKLERRREQNRRAARRCRQKKKISQARTDISHYSVKIANLQMEENIVKMQEEVNHLESILADHCKSGHCTLVKNSPTNHQQSNPKLLHLQLRQQQAPLTPVEHAQTNAGPDSVGPFPLPNTLIPLCGNTEQHTDMSCLSLDTTSLKTTPIHYDHTSNVRSQAYFPDGAPGNNCLAHNMDTVSDEILNAVCRTAELGHNQPALPVVNAEESNLPSWDLTKINPSVSNFLGLNVSCSVFDYDDVMTGETTNLANGSPVDVSFRPQGEEYVAEISIMSRPTYTQPDSDVPDLAILKEQDQSFDFYSQIHGANINNNNDDGKNNTNNNTASYNNYNKNNAITNNTVQNNNDNGNHTLLAKSGDVLTQVAASQAEMFPCVSPNLIFPDSAGLSAERAGHRECPREMYCSPSSVYHDSSQLTLEAGRVDPPSVGYPGGRELTPTAWFPPRPYSNSPHTHVPSENSSCFQYSLRSPRSQEQNTCLDSLFQPGCDSDSSPLINSYRGDN